MNEILHKIGLGSVQFGVDYGISNTRGKTASEEVTKIIDYAARTGIGYIDTASAYGNAEQVLGSCELDKFKIVSKFMPLGDRPISEQLESSLKKLRIQSLFGYLAHRPQDLIENRENWNSLVRLKAQEKVRKIGFSLNWPTELEQLMNIGMIPDLVQVPYNFFDRRFEIQMNNLKKMGCEVHVRSVFLQGLFFMDSEKLPQHFESIKGILANLQNTHGENLASALLNFVLKKEFVDVLIMGIESLQQLKDNIEKLELTETIQLEIPVIEEHISAPTLWPSK